MQQRLRKADAIERQPEFLFPERGEGWPEAALGQGDSGDCRQEQEDARRRSPAGEIERRRAHPVAERAQHRIGERALVPRPVVAAAIDEKGWSDQRSARRGAGLVRVHPRLRADDRRIVRRPAIGRHAEIARDRFEIVLGQDLRARHQLDVFLQEALRIRGALDQFGGAARNLDAGQRPVAKDVAHTIAELVAHLGDALVGCAAIGACVAAIFDQRDGGVRRADGRTCHPPADQADCSASGQTCKRLTISLSLR
jgi:hypothetical protein